MVNIARRRTGTNPTGQWRPEDPTAAAGGRAPSQFLAPVRRQPAGVKGTDGASPRNACGYPRRMATVRENGYREYPDHLTPGKGGESSLLFDKDGRLSGHAPFRPAVGDDESPSPEDGKLLGALGMLVLLGLGYGLGKGAKWVRDTVRARRTSTASSSGVTTEADVEDVGVPSDLSHGAESDADDELIEEVTALCDEVGSKILKPESDRLPSVEPDSEHAASIPPTRKRRLR